MRDIIYIGPTPCEEDCAQVGSDNYARKAKAECRHYIAALRKYYGEEPDGAILRIQSESHDFGTYYEVVVSYDTENPQAVEYAYKVDAGLAFWSDAGMEAPEFGEGK